MILLGSMDARVALVSTEERLPACAIVGGGWGRTAC